MSRMTRSACVLATLVCALAATAPAFAQWSADPADSLIVSDPPVHRGKARIVPTTDGGFYIAWGSVPWTNPMYPVHVQRLDVAGRELWPHNGLAIGRSGASADFTTDTHGNAVLAVDAALVKIAPDGSYPWGASGVVLSGSTSIDQIAAGSDGDVVGLWVEGRGLRLQKLDAAGTPQWVPGATIELAPPFNAKEPQLVAADNGSVIAAWVADGYPTTPATAFAQKFGADGTPLWGKGQPVALSAVLVHDNVMALVLRADGAGGVVAAWHDGGFRTGVSFTVRAQHLDSNGKPLLVEGGRPVVAAHAGWYPQFPAITHDPASGDIYVLWGERPDSAVALYAQRFDAGGQRGFGEGGKRLLSLDENVFIQELTALPAPGGVLAAWTAYDLRHDGRPGTRIEVVRLDASGNHLFVGERIGLKSAPSMASRPAAALSTAGYAAFVWTDSIAGREENILAQNIQFDGTLGNPVDNLFANGFEDAPASGE